MMSPNAAVTLPTVVGHSPVNHVVLEGTLIAPPEFRRTPSGRLVASLEIEHVSLESGVDHPQRIELRMPILALGTVAEECRLFCQGASLSVEGWLNQKRWIRDGKVRWGRTELLAQHVTLLNPQKSPSP